MQGELGSNTAKWCQENLCNESAEKVLKTSRQGRFVVWRGKSPIDYYLSYIDKEHVTHHMPIKQLGKSFYFDGQRFSELPELVLYHLTMRESPDILQSGTSEIAAYEGTHICSSQTISLPANSSFSVGRGDVLCEIRRMDNRWLLAKHLPSGAISFFDLRHTIPLGEVTAPEALPYFHTTSPHVLTRILNNGGRGSFLIRRSRRPSAFTLLVHTGGEIQKFLIEVEENGYRLSGKQFDTIGDIIRRYTARHISLACSLSRAVLADDSTPPSDGSDRVGRNVIASVGALTKTKEDKEWRRCTVTLFQEATNAILDIGDPVAGSRFALLLSQTELFCLHETVLGREAIYLLPYYDHQISVFLYFSSLDFHFGWFHLLRKYTVHRMELIGHQGISFFSSSYHLPLLSLHIDKFKSDTVKDGLFRSVCSVNGVAVCSTVGQPVTSSSSIVFDAHFLILCVPCKCEVQLSLVAMSRGKNCRPSAVSPLLALPDAQTLHEQRQSGFSFSVVLRRVPVFDAEVYTPLAQLVHPQLVGMCEWASSRLLSPQRNLLAIVLVSLSWPCQLHLLFENTLGRTFDESENLLRQDSFGTCLLTASLRLTARASVENALETLGASKRKTPLEAEEVVHALMSVGREAPVMAVLRTLAQLVESKYQGRPHVARRALSAAFFLRFTNPLLISMLGMDGSQLAKSIQVSANIATSTAFCPTSPSTSPLPCLLFQFFEEIRLAPDGPSIPEEALHVVPEQFSLLCHLLSLSLSPEVPPSSLTPSSSPSSSLPPSSMTPSSSPPSSLPPLSLSNSPFPSLPPAIIHLIQQHSSA